MLNTGAAVAAARRPFAILQTAGAVAASGTITLDAGNSFASNGRSLVSYQWSVESAGGGSPVIAAPAQASTTLRLPDSGQLTLLLTITDDQGDQDSDTVTLAIPAVPTTPVPASSGGGGGGNTGWELIAFLAWLGVRRGRPQRSLQC
jgi:hypothetical protein